MSKNHLHRLTLALLLILVLCPLSLRAQDDAHTRVRFVTNKGSFTIELYDDTPLHKERVLSHVAAGDYDGLLFHRVIRNFMVQAGGALHKGTRAEAEKLEALSEATIPAEIVYPGHFHKRGTVAAARIGDEGNPERRSDGIQFFVCVGQFFLEKELLPYAKDSIAPMTEEIKESYMLEGGVPHLDGRYTVFGEIVDGMNTILKIQAVETDGDDRPTRDVYIKSAKVVR